MPQARSTRRRQMGEENSSWRQDETTVRESKAMLSQIWVNSDSTRSVLVRAWLRCRRLRMALAASLWPFSISHRGDSGRNQTPMPRMTAGMAWMARGNRQEKAPVCREQPYPTHCYISQRSIVRKIRAQRNILRRPHPAQASTAASHRESPEYAREKSRSEDRLADEHGENV
jgi:hypothetical protein